MPVSIRDATPDDAEAFVGILNPIIEDGTTTAHRTLFDADRMIAHYIEPPRLIACKAAVMRSTVVGFQTTEWADPEWPGPGALPHDWAIVASFVQRGLQARGVGGSLFAATRAAVRAAGAVAIDATIRADNTPGLAYYSRMGFTDYDRLTGVALSDGTPVDLIRKRYDIPAQA